jgi:hypothetical protein
VRYRFLFLLLLLSLSACSFQVDVLTPEPSAILTVSTPTTVVATELLSATPPTIPTLAPTTVPGTPDPNIIPIQFSPNGTYIDVAGGIQAGSSETYSISASKGQVMSISVDQGSEGDWVYIPIQIMGADGKTLCPAAVNAECTFWRGILPSTQEYFVTLTPVNAVNFTMRVAINPPGVATQSFQYLSRNGRASFSHTDEFAPVRFSGAEVSKIAPELTLEFVDTQSYLNTNLFEAFFLFGSSSSVDLVQTCTQPISFGGPENILGEKDVNGVKFVHSEGGGVAAGNIYEQTYYRAASQGVCYEITFFVHYGNIGNYSPELGVKEFDRAALLQKFEAILSRLVIK